MDAPARARRPGRGRGRGRPGRGRGRRGGTTIPRDDARETRERRKIVIRNLPATLAREALEEALRRDGFGALDETFEWWEYASDNYITWDGDTAVAMDLYYDPVVDEHLQTPIGLIAPTWYLSLIHI